MELRQIIPPKAIWASSILAVAVGLLAGHAASAVVARTDPQAALSLEEVLVTGERPGPGMWQVTKDGHGLWILATLEPLPKKMTWRSTAVEAQIAASQAILAPPEVSADIGFFRGLALIPALLRAKKNPTGQTLEQALPHELYMRWLALRVKFLGRSDDEQLRPMLAALDLYLHALDESGLTTDDNVWKVVERNARDRRVPIVPVAVKLTLEDPRKTIRQLQDISHDTEISCLEKTMERIETDLQPMRQRANLWSSGDVVGLRAMTYPDERIACLDAFFSVPQLRDQLLQARARLGAAWLAAAEAALAQHSSTLAVVPLTELLGEGGYLDRLRDRGYEIQEP